MDDFTTPNPKKRKREAKEASSGTKPTSTWIVPSFLSAPGGSSTTQKSTKSFLSSNHLATKKVSAGGDSRGVLAFDPRHLFSSQGSSTSSPAPKSHLPLSTLGPKFMTPRSLLESTPAKNNEPMLPPLFQSPRHSSPRTPMFAQEVFRKPLNQTPLTTRLAKMIAPPDRVAGDGEITKSGLGQLLSESSRMALADHGATLGEDYEAKDPVRHMSEVTKGLELSPVRKDRYGRGSKNFVKNGLAERANLLINHAQNDLALWSHDIGRSLSAESQNVRSVGATTQPDMRLSIREILIDFRIREQAHEELGLKNHAAHSTGPPYALARCKVLRLYQKAAMLDVKGKGKQVDSEPAINSDIIVLFSFSTVSSSSSAAAVRVSSVVGFDEGKEVMVWKPWINVPSSRDISANTNTSSIRPTVIKDDPAMPIDIPPIGNSDTLPYSILSALLCSRFVVVRDEKN